ncbi:MULTISPECIES: SDR family NAD(P)-dependent oxidoreductase [Roseobacteraceae]|uniref:SDR family NAD(P)-dependent oxidoreductase n=1 Tax=Roseobacteraceae TaxID=2854170 RepID=UPI000DE84A24|nr:MULTISPECIES: SDR family NAD(P)-dependent oxidoreductase [Roseobacteraceae]MBT8167486.1 SDR family NAD(P)-dependent oxidoreductase [Falsiruegeria litorea]RBW57454.1 short-chain dehydrogenase [Ruegeria sp. A3M17]
MLSSSLPLCIITGVGDATGTSVVRRFASSGYNVAMIARNEGRIAALEQEIETAFAFPCDISDLQAFENTLSRIRSSFGIPQVLIHNAVAHTFGRLMEVDPSELEKNFRVNTTALLHFVRFFVPDMVDRGTGTILATGNTASLRGVPNYVLFAPTKAAQRVLCEALARDLGPQGIHVGYVIVDAAIDVSWLGETDADRPGWLTPPADWPHKRKDFFADPNGIANEIFHMAHQDRTVWSFETTIRPFAEPW